VDGGLESTMYQAQALLADAYIAAGAATQAGVIAQGLVGRGPGGKGKNERVPRGPRLPGGPGARGLNAPALSGAAAVDSTDLLSGESLFDEPPAPVAAPAPEPELEVETDDIDALLAEPIEVQTPKQKPDAKPKKPTKESHHFQLSANAIDLDSILGDFDDGEIELDPAPAPKPKPKAAPQAHAETDDVEVDLSIVIDDIKKPEAPAPPAKTKVSEAAADLDGVFGNLREQAAKRSGLDDAEKEYKRGLALRSAGDIDGCIQALEKASRAPKLRFMTSWLIARLYRERDMMPKALEW